MSGTTIILVNWNGARDTIECLESLMRLEDEDFSVVIVDNDSADGSREAIAAWCAEATGPRPDGPPWSHLPEARRFAPTFRAVALADDPAPVPDGSRITLIAAGANLGFAAANNIGMAFAGRDAGARFFWLLNNDTVVRPDALGRLLNHAARHPDEGIIGNVLLFYDRPDVVQGVGGWMEPDRAMAGHIGFGEAIEGLPDKDAIEARLAYVMGASMFVRRAVFTATGGMNEAYFLYFEEPDWARRLPDGVRQGVCLDAVVWHKEGGSIGTSSRARPSDTSLYYYTVNTLRFFWRYERRFLPVAVARIVWNGMHYARGGDHRAVKVLLRALLDGATGRRGTPPRSRAAPSPLS